MVENGAGAGGTVGTLAIARSPADGTVIGLGSVSSMAISPVRRSDPPFDVEHDCTFISGLWQLPNLLIVNDEVPARTVPELIELIRRAIEAKLAPVIRASGARIEQRPTAARDPVRCRRQKALTCAAGMGVCWMRLAPGMSGREIVTAHPGRRCGHRIVLPTIASVVLSSAIQMPPGPCRAGPDAQYASRASS